MSGSRRMDISPGTVFDYLTVVEFSDSLQGKNRRAYWLCKCRCGATSRVAGSDLRLGKVRSCGCRLQQTRYRTHGRGGHTEKKDPTYISYTAAKGRCENSKDPSYKYYGGRGIRFKFKDFSDFHAELGDRPTGKSLDRFPDNDGDYEPGNVRWATAKMQAANRCRPGGRRDF
jgi:hypothetical protein